MEKHAMCTKNYRTTLVGYINLIQGQVEIIPVPIECTYVSTNLVAVYTLEMVTSPSNNGVKEHQVTNLQG